MRLPFLLFIALTCLFFPVDQASAFDSADVARHFLPDTHFGATHVYRIVSTGSVAVEGPEPHVVAFQISTEAAITYGRPGSDGMIPFRIAFGQPAAQGIDASVAQALEAAEIHGTLRPNGALADISTPAALQELGLDLGDLIIGLIVPHPDGPPADIWTIRYSRSGQSSTLPRSAVLEGTFTAQGLKEWGNRLLSSVTARLRGDATLRQGAVSNQIQEIGHALYYLDPQTGATEMASVSIITNIRTSARPSSDVRTKITLTTTFERRRDREPARLAPPSESDETLVPPEAPVAAESLHEAEATQPAEETQATDEAQAVEEVQPAEDLDLLSPKEQGEPSEPQAIDSTPETPGHEVASVDPIPAIDTEDARIVPDEQVLEEQREPTAPRHVYVDPAGRFALDLPAGWPPAPTRISLRGTSFHQNGEAIYIHVMPLPSQGATAESIARSAIATYQETQDNFTVVAEPTPITLDGQAAYEAFYRYTEPPGYVVSEWGAFSRRGDRAYYVQYARQGEHEKEPVPAIFQALIDSFEFGPTPAGLVNAERLAESLELYEDREMGFRLLVPALWPLVDRADDGSSSTFAEIGGRGYLTVIAQDGAAAFTAEQIIAAWRDEWAKEQGFRLIRDVHAAELAGKAGVGLEYHWVDFDDSGWTGRLVAVIDGDTLYAVEVNYETPGVAMRAETFEAMLASFEIFEPGRDGETGVPAAEDSASLPSTESEPEPRTPPAETEALPIDEAPRPFREPADDESVILLGRAMTRYQPDGSLLMREEWVSNATVYVRVGNDEYAGATDSDGYIYVSNLPRLTEGSLYELTRIEAPMFGFVQPVAITFQHLEVGQVAPRVADVGIVEVTLESDRRLTVDVRRPVGEGASGRSALEHFVDAFPSSAWAPHVEEAIAYRDNM